MSLQLFLFIMYRNFIEDFLGGNFTGDSTGDFVASWITRKITSFFLTVYDNNKSLIFFI